NRVNHREVGAVVGPLDVVMIVGDAGPGQVDRRGAGAGYSEGGGGDHDDDVDHLGRRGVSLLVRRYHPVEIVLVVLERAQVDEVGIEAEDGSDGAKVGPVGGALDPDAGRVGSEIGVGVGPGQVDLRAQRASLHQGGQVFARRRQGRRLGEEPEYG